MAKNDTFEQEWRCRPCGIVARTSIGGQDGMHAVPTSLIDDSMSYDHTQAFRAVVADRVKPDLMLEYVP